MLHPGMRRIQENVVINTKNKSHSVTADLEVPSSGARGVIVAQGGSMGGWTLYVHEGKLSLLLQLPRQAALRGDGDVAADVGRPPGADGFAGDGGGIGKGAGITLYVDGNAVGTGHVGRTHALFFSMDETLEVGCDVGEPVSPDYGPRDNAFNGTVNWVQIDVDAAATDADHMIAAAERFQLAVARQ